MGLFQSDLGKACVVAAILVKIALQSSRVASVTEHDRDQSTFFVGDTEYGHDMIDGTVRVIPLAAVAGESGLAFTEAQSRWSR